MTAITLQKKIIKIISEIDNIAVLKSIATILEQQNCVTLSETQKKIIALSEIDIINGDVVEHKQAMNQIANKHGW